MKSKLIPLRLNELLGARACNRILVEGVMHTVGLNHFNITAPDELLEKVRDFYVEVLGLAVGERPSFRRKGFWLYAGHAPLVHLTACDEADVRSDGEVGRNFFDHIAFSCKGLARVIERLKEWKIPYEMVEIASPAQVQVFVRDPAGVGVELNFVDESLKSGVC
jgi:catechol 2,3-dioxygenase-like lactoylglutathione lyase family enzyme